MKSKIMASLILSLITFFPFALVHVSGEVTPDLSGEWDAIFIWMRAEEGNTFDIEEDIVEIIQKGNQFIGKCMIGGKRRGKNEEAVKGKLSNGALEETFITYPIDQITYKLDWSKGRATINEDGDLMVFYSALKDEPIHLTFILKRRK